MDQLRLTLCEFNEAYSEVQMAYAFMLKDRIWDLTKEMTDLMTSQRSFQMNARAVSYAGSDDWELQIIF